MDARTEQLFLEVVEEQSGANSNNCGGGGKTKGEDCNTPSRTTSDVPLPTEPLITPSDLRDIEYATVRASQHCLRCIAVSRKASLLVARAATSCVCGLFIYEPMEYMSNCCSKFVVVVCALSFCESAFCHAPTKTTWEHAHTQFLKRIVYEVAFLETESPMRQRARKLHRAIEGTSHANDDVSSLEDIRDVIPLALNQFQTSRICQLIAAASVQGAHEFL